MSVEEKIKALSSVLDRISNDPARGPRFRQLVQEWRTFYPDDPESLRAKLKAENIVTQKEMDALNRSLQRVEDAMVADDPYPWSRMAVALIQELAKGTDVVDTCTAVADRIGYEDPMVREAAIQMFASTYNWLHSRKRILVRVRSDAAFLLKKVSVQREQIGKKPIEWREAPSPNVETEAMMFVWDGPPKSVIFAYMLDGFLHYMHWVKCIPGKSKMPGSNWNNIFNFAPKITEESLVDLNARGKVSQTLSLKGKNGTPMVTVPWQDCVPYMNGAFNLVAAINSAPSYNVLKPSRPGGKNKITLGNVRNVHPYEIDMAELTRWSEYYINIKDAR